MRVYNRYQLLCAVSLLSLLTNVTATPAAPVDSTDSVEATDNSVKAGNKPNAVGTKFAPVDGKDGIPREGPWVETSAQRERKKTKGSEGVDEIYSESHESLKEFKDKKIPQSNEGVMDDKGRSSPVEGTRGTEGGISEKSKNKEVPTVEQKRPDAPKEVPPIPHSEKEHMKTGTKDVEAAKDAIDDEIRKPLEKPKDLPEKPYSGTEKDAILPGDEIPRGSTTQPVTLAPGEKEDIVQPLHSLFLAFTMILFSEIGDKTFLVACLMAMRHDRLLVFSAAFSALITMTVLSAVLGHAVPTLIPKWLTNFLAAGLFLVFGVKMLLEARNISPDEGVSEEMKEVEQELEEKEHEALRRSRRRSSISPYVLESGRGGIRKGRSESGRLPSPPDSPISEASSRSSSPSHRSTLQNITTGVSNLFGLLLSPAWVQTFVMTFLGEWGDRSQIATIAMAAGSDYWWVTAGALGGHAICTSVAVLGGKAIAGKVSLRTVTMGGAVAFLVFGVVYLLEAIY